MGMKRRTKCKQCDGCLHNYGCYTCGCTCKAKKKKTCPCCGATDT